MDVQKSTARFIGRLNRAGILAVPISYSEVIDALLELSPKDARKILADLEEDAHKIWDPTKYILSAVKRCANGSGDTPPPPWRNEPLWTPPGISDPSGRIGRQVGWLNQRAGLAEPISYNNVVGPLTGLDIGEAMKILKDVETNASGIEKPTAYINAAAARVANASYARWNQWQLDPTGKIARQVGWLNVHGFLNDKISFSDVVGPLSNIDVYHAMTILKDLQDRAENVTNPTSYVIAAAHRKMASQGSQPPSYGWQSSAWGDDNGWEYWEQPAGASADSLKKISRQVGWLNIHASLNERISYSDVVGPLSNIDITSAMKILKDLEKYAETVSHPTAYVIAAAKRVQADTGVTAPRGNDNDGKRISKQVGWLNASETLAEAISYSDVKEPLASCGADAAMKILHDLSNAADRVENPTSYVIAAAKRAAAGNGYSGGHKSAKTKSERRYVPKPATDDEESAGDAQEEERLEPS